MLAGSVKNYTQYQQENQIFGVSAPAWTGGLPAPQFWQDRYFLFDLL